MNEQDIITAIRVAQAIVDLDRVEIDAPRKVIVRGDRSGVFYGDLLAHNGREVTLGQARHIWQWFGAANTAELANAGTSKPNECRIVGPTTKLMVLDAIEIIDCTAAAVTSLDAVPHWTKQ